MVSVASLFRPTDNMLIRFAPLPNRIVNPFGKICRDDPRTVHEV